MFKIYLLLEKRILNPRWFYSVLHKEKSKVLLLYVDLSLIKNSYKVIVLYVASFHLVFFQTFTAFYNNEKWKQIFRKREKDLIITYEVYYYIYLKKAIDAASCI